MIGLNECLVFMSAVSSVICFPYPVSQPGPGYQNPQYVSAQALPQLAYKQPQAIGYREPQHQPQQYVRQPVAQPVYEPKGGLQNYASYDGPLSQQNQKPQTVSQIYLNQINPSHLAAQAQEAFSSAAPTKAPAQAYQPQQTYQPQQAFKPVALQLQYQPQAHQQYLKEQQPQFRYVSRPVQQYKAQQPAQQLGGERVVDEKEDYDHNPSYQFGFDVKDDLYTNYQNRKEQREGDKITGSYSVVDSDGFIRTVSYTADPKEGFKAEVTRQPTDIVVKIPKPQPQFHSSPRQQQYVQEGPRNQQQEQRQQPNVVYQYQ